MTKLAIPRWQAATEPAAADGVAMRWRHDEWAQRWNAERLVAGVAEVLRRWDHDPARAARELDTLLRVASPRAVVFLEGVYRGRRRSLAPMLGTDVDALLAELGRHAPAVAALLTFDRSGYLREAGVRQLATGEELFVLPFLLLRLNDPVEPVRDRATAAVSQRLGVGNAALLVQLLPLIEGLSARRRAGRIARAIGDRLVSGDPAGRAALWAGARGDDVAVRASCLRLLAVADPAGAVEHAMSTGDPALRHWAAGVATAPAFDAALQRRLLPRLESDPHPRVRWRALRARTRHPGAEPALRRGLLDPDARVRYLARVRLRALGHTDSVELYRSTLADPDADPDALVGALAGLADMGTRADAAQLLAFLDHPTARVRGEAWRALATLDPDAFHGRVDQLRADPSGKVRRHLRV
ncbi:HEAT repeat domain-containing protein [Actinomycetes bacterium KLBMP 9797]